MVTTYKMRSQEYNFEAPATAEDLTRLAWLVENSMNDAWVKAAAEILIQWASERPDWEWKPTTYNKEPLYRRTGWGKHLVINRASHTRGYEANFTADAQWEKSKAAAARRA